MQDSSGVAGNLLADKLRKVRRQYSLAHMKEGMLLDSSSVWQKGQYLNHLPKYASHVADGFALLYLQSSKLTAQVR